MKAAQTDMTNYKFVQIENEDLIRMAWEMSAEENNINLLSLSSRKELDEYMSNLSHDVSFYIDSDLGEFVPRGQEVAKDLFEEGYQNLYLSTGFAKSDLPEMHWIKGINGKIPPWIQ
jgi:hypothetical protein